MQSGGTKKMRIMVSLPFEICQFSDDQIILSIKYCVVVCHASYLPSSASPSAPQPSSLFINFLGPSHWNETFEMCDHGKQSPIDISSPMTDRILDRIRFHGYNQMPSTITARHDDHAGEWIMTTTTMMIQWNTIKDIHCHNFCSTIERWKLQKQLPIIGIKLFLLFLTFML